MKDTVALLERSVNQTRRVLASVPEARRHAATPCPDWDVSALVQHVIAQDLHNFVVAARGDMVDWQAPADQLDDDWISAFDARATLVLETWRAADLDREVTGPGDLKAALRGRADQQIAELAIHSWDLVQATSQDTPLDDELAEHALAWSHGMLRPAFRGPDKSFGAEVPVEDNAPAYDRLAGWFGRDPQWATRHAGVPR